MSGNSTNVRAQSEAARPWLRLGTRALAAVSPRLAAAAVAPLFFKAPPRRQRSEAEQEVLSRGERLELGSGRDRIVAWRWGRGPAVLLAHGWGGCSGQLTPFVAPLLEAGFSVVAHDAPAHGQSPGWAASIPAFASAIARVAEAAGPLHGALAHSMGGAALSLAVARGLPARRMVFVGPPADAAVWFQGFARWLALPVAAEAALRARAEAIAGEPLDRLNTRVLGPRMKFPLLVIHDRQDREVPLEDGAQVARDAAAGRLLVTEGLGHRRILRDPGVAAAAVRFLAGEAGDTLLPAA